jgi:Predicted glutamine amidotransferases
MSSPRIALSTLYDPEENPEKLRYYVRAIELGGGEVIFLHPDTCRFDPRRLDALDGILLAGGGDVHPRYYRAEIDGTNVDSIHEGRDQMEFRLLQLARERDLPVLAICRGIQVLNVAFGGSLIQHLSGHMTEAHTALVRHVVRIRPHTRLWEALGRHERLVVNSHHHQGLGEREKAPSLQASAFLDGEIPLVEGVESPHHHWIVGVQWHPERFHEFEGESREAQMHLFRTFVQACVRIRVR